MTSLRHGCSDRFDAQNSTVQTRVKELVVAGQYGFNEGGWVQPDEGCTNYLGRINQAYHLNLNLNLRGGVVITPSSSES